MSAPAKDAMRRGWCPSTLRPMETGDGLLVRLHPPGARLNAAQLARIAALATEYGNGLIEISARANLQLRGVTVDSHPPLVERLLAEGLVDEHEGDGPQRITLVSPLAGCAAGTPGFIDAEALGRAIETAARAIADLPAKFTVIVDDGGASSLDGFPGDLRLRGVGADELIMRLADGPWRGPVAATQAVAVVEMILRRFAQLRGGAADRIRRLHDLAAADLAALTDVAVAAAPGRRPAPKRAGLFGPPGGPVTALVALPFGRSDARTLTRLTEAVAGEPAEIRLSPWRGLAFRGLSQSGAERLLAVAQSLGLIVGDDDPRLSVQACAGSPACARGEAPAAADAGRLTEALFNGLGDISLHVSGCTKGCAHPSPADLTLVGREGRYDIVWGGRAGDAPVATLDLPALLARLQPGGDLRARLTTGRNG